MLRSKRNNRSVSKIKNPRGIRKRNAKNEVSACQRIPKKEVFDGSEENQGSVKFMNMEIKLEPMEYKEKNFEKKKKTEEPKKSEKEGLDFLMEYYQEENDELEAIRAICLMSSSNLSIPRDSVKENLKIETPPQPAESSAENTIKTTNSKEFLKLLRGLVRCFSCTIHGTSRKNLQDFLKKIDKAIEKVRVKEHKIPIDDIITIFNASLRIVIKTAMTSPPASEDSTSLRGFLGDLRCILAALSIPALEDFQETINENIRELDGQDKIISIEKIRIVLETVFALIT